MAEPQRPPITYRKTGPPGANRYQVLEDGEVIGTVGRFRMSVGQFGSRWMATTPDGHTSTQFTSRDAAARWLVKR